MIPKWLSPLPWAAVAAAQFWLLASGGILSYLHPKAVPLAWALALFCLLAALVELWSLRQGPRRMKLSVAAVVWALPLSALAFVQEGGLSHRAALSRGLAANVLQPAPFSEDSAFEVEGPDSLGNYPVTEDSTPSLEAPATTVAPLPEAMTKSLPAKVLERLDTIPDADFTGKVNRIWQSPAKWRGRTVLMTGFVTADETFGAGGFFLTRMMLSCCAADAMPVGFFCQPLGAVLPEGQWITVVAKVGITSAQLDGWKETRTVPILTVLSYARTQAPENPYVYPFSLESDPRITPEGLDLVKERAGIP